MAKISTQARPDGQITRGGDARGSGHRPVVGGAMTAPGSIKAFGEHAERGALLPLVQFAPQAVEETRLGDLVESAWQLCALALAGASERARAAIR